MRPSRPSRRALVGLALPALVLAGCGSDSAEDEIGDDLSDDATLTETTELEIDDTVATTVTEPETDGVGTITIAGEARTLAAIVGGNSCRLGDDEFVVAAESDTPLDEGGVAMVATIDRRNPEDNRFSVTVGDVVYEAPSFRTIEVETSGTSVNGLVEVEAIVDAGPVREQVTFDVDCAGWPAPGSDTDPDIDAG